MHDKPGVRSGKLKDGSSIGVRPISKGGGDYDSASTIEVRKPGSKRPIKIRFR